MSDETLSSPENPAAPEAEINPRVRRVSTPRTKKTTAEAPPTTVTAEIPSIPFPTTPHREERSEDPSQGSNDWPEPEIESSSDGVPSQSESSKRKRRRRKGKGQGNSSQINATPSEEETPLTTAAESKPADAPQDPRPRSQPAPSHPPQPRAKIDPELLTKMAWKIYLAEVSEEGVALIGDNDAKDLSRRCFRLAEIFIEEQSRRR